MPAEDLRRELRLSKTPGKNGAERRAEPRLTKGEHKAAGGLVVELGLVFVLVLPGRWSRLFVPDCRVGGLSLAEGQSVRSRDPAGGTERLPFPPPVRTEIAARTRSSSPKPRPSCRADDASNAQHEPVDHAGGTRSCGRGRRTGRHAQGSRDFLFFWGFV